MTPIMAVDISRCCGAEIAEIYDRDSLVIGNETQRHDRPALGIERRNEDQRFRLA